MNVVTIDFETYYDKTFSLSKLTTEEYIRDARFEVIGVSTKTNKDKPVWVPNIANAVKIHFKKFDWNKDSFWFLESTQKIRLCCQVSRNFMKLNKSTK